MSRRPADVFPSRRLALAAGAALALLVSGCGGEETAAGACAQPSAVPVPEPLPVDIGAFGVVTKLQRAEDFVAATVVSATLVSELFDAASRAAEDAGYEIVAADDEGIEFELFLASGEDESGLLRASQTTCEGQTLIQLTLSGDAPATPR